jgi:hypothetical protein
MYAYPMFPLYYSTVGRLGRGMVASMIKYKCEINYIISIYKERGVQREAQTLSRSRHLTR